ncbi:MAG: XdhC family protein [Pseudomonadota bacterium]
MSSFCADVVSTSNMAFTDNPIPFLHERLCEGQKVGLATLVAVDGSSPRPVGSQIGIADNGNSVGMITGGCAEAALVTQTLHHMEAGSRGLERYGTGSPYLDVKLPCGSGLDVHFDGALDPSIIDDLYATRIARRPRSLSLFAEGPSLAHDPAVVPAGQPLFTQSYTPPFRLLIFGEGAYPLALALFAAPLGYEIAVYSPSAQTCAIVDKTFCGNERVTAHPITHRDDFTAVAIDQWTGIVTLFHDHDWEVPILTAALSKPAAYIGALGSRKTHTTRAARLAEHGFTREAISTIHGPVGLDIGASDPNEIAVSILAQIIANQHRRQENAAGNQTARHG